MKWKYCTVTKSYFSLNKLWNKSFNQVSRHPMTQWDDVYLFYYLVYYSWSTPCKRTMVSRLCTAKRRYLRFVEDGDRPSLSTYPILIKLFLVSIIRAPWSGKYINNENKTILVMVVFIYNLLFMTKSSYRTVLVIFLLNSGWYINTRK